MPACGVLGFFMRRYGMSPAAMVIALVLGPLAEETLRQTMVVSGGDLTIFLQRTTSVYLLVAIALLLLVPVAAPWIRQIVLVRVRNPGVARRRRERLRRRQAARGQGPAGEVAGEQTGAGPDHGARPAAALGARVERGGNQQEDHDGDPGGSS